MPLNPTISQVLHVLKNPNILRSCFLLILLSTGQLYDMKTGFRVLALH